MAELNYCPHCGAALYEIANDCEFCGKPLRQKKKSLNEQVNDSARSFSESAKKSIEKAENNADFDIVIFIVLLIFFWPGALIYYFVKNN
jgi:uncharacterized membrane protein YvbJ